MAPIKSRTVGTYKCLYMEWERDKKTENKVALLFASEIYFSTNQGGKLKSPEESAEFGSNWKSKMSMGELEKYKDILEPGKVYEIKAAEDSFSLGGNAGIWYQILEIKKIGDDETEETEKVTAYAGY